MKYIGPFLRINIINKNNINNQMFHLSKETLKHLTLQSRCGISITSNDFIKHSSDIDINTIKDFYPLLCIYKKANPKLIAQDNTLFWNEEKFKKEINIFSNSLMTLSLLELVDYYSSFENIDKKNFSLRNIYLRLAQKQLEFYATNLRNSEGVFVDKIDVSESLIDKTKFEEKSKKFKYSDQAFLMCAYYKYSTYDNSKIGIEYKNFSFDILNMLIFYKQELYELPNSELLKLCIAMNIFYDYSKELMAKSLMLDLSDLLIERYKLESSFNSKNKLENSCMLYLNFEFMYSNSDILKFKESAEDVYSKLLQLYNDDFGIFIKKSDDKKIKYSCSDILLYLYSTMIHSTLQEDRSSERIITEIFKNQVINSGIILSWPDTPNLNNAERYRNYSLNSDDLIDDINFRMPTFSTPTNNEFASVFIKSIQFNKKKGTFKPYKLTFDSSKNMLIFFTSIYYHNHIK